MSEAIKIHDENGKFIIGNKAGGPGRPKKLLKRVDEILSARGFHPVHKLLDLYEHQTDKTKVQICLELLPYVQPKPREMVLTDDELLRQQVKEMTQEQLIEIVKPLMLEGKAG